MRTAVRAAQVGKDTSFSVMSSVRRHVAVARSQVMFAFCLIVLALNCTIATLACSGAADTLQYLEIQNSAGYVKNVQAQRGLLKAMFLQSGIFLFSWMPTVVLGGAHVVQALTPEQVRIAKIYSVRPVSLR